MRVRHPATIESYSVVSCLAINESFFFSFFFSFSITESHLAAINEAYGLPLSDTHGFSESHLATVESYGLSLSAAHRSPRVISASM